MSEAHFRELKEGCDELLAEIFKPSPKIQTSVPKSIETNWSSVNVSWNLKSYTENSFAKKTTISNRELVRISPLAYLASLKHY